MRKIILAVMALLLTACSSDPNSFWRSPTLAMEARAKAAEDRANTQCASFGFKPGTDAFANCRLRLAESDKRAAMLLSAQPAPVLDFSVPQPAPWPPAPIYSAPRSLHCTSTNAVPGYTSTNCY